MGLEIQSVIGDKGQRSDGVWIDYPDEEGVSFRLAYLGNDGYQDFVSQRMMRARRGRRDVPPDKQREIVVQGLVKHVVRDWKGLTSNGQPFEFNEANAKLFLDQSAVIRDWIVQEANSLDNFGGTEHEETSPAGDMKSGSPVGS